MKKTKEEIMNTLLHIEGGYVDNPHDSGGRTNWGITIRTARAHGYNGKMKDLTREEAVNIYKESYWDIIRLDEIYEISIRLTEKLFDISVNLGPRRSIQFFKRGLNIMHQYLESAEVQNFDVDSQEISNTLLEYFRVIMKSNRYSEEVLFKILNSLQGNYYINSATKHKKNHRFIYGWFKNRVWDYKNNE